MSHTTSGVLFSALAILLFVAAWNGVDGESAAQVQHLSAALAGFCLCLGVYLLML